MLVAPGSLRSLVPTSLQEIELRSTVGGADATGSGTASGSPDTRPAFPASNAFDNNSGTLWHGDMSSQLNDTYWLKYDFGTSTEVAQIAITARSDAPSQCPGAWLIQSSDDDSMWTGRGLFIISSAWTSGETKTYTLPASFGTAKRGWRCRVVKTSDVNTACAELIFRDTPAGTRVVGGVFGAAFASSYLGGYPAEALFDANNSTFWYEGLTLTYTVGGWTDSFTGDVREVTWVPTTAQGASNNPDSFFVDSSVDGITWVEVAEITPSLPWNNTVSQTFDLPASGGGGGGSSLTTLARTSTMSTFRR
jgi:hypothetical protein